MNRKMTILLVEDKIKLKAHIKGPLRLGKHLVNLNKDFGLQMKKK